MSASTDYANSNNYYVHILGLHSGVSVKFKAILSSFKDQLDSKFNSEEVYGRNDPIMTFQGTTRKLSMTLQVPASDITEATSNFQSLSRLMASLYPGYSESNSATTISTAPLHKIKLANWVTSGGEIGGVSESGLVVALEGASFSPNLDAGVMENGPKLLPKQFDLELTMTVLHTEQVGWNSDGWLGSRRYPYTEIAEDISLNNPEAGETNMTIGPTQEEFEAQEQVYQKALEDYLLDQQQGGNAASGLGMSMDIYE